MDQHLLPPGPRGRIGLRRRTLARPEALAAMGQWAREFGDVVRFRLGGRTCYQFSHPDACHALLGRQSGHFRPPCRWPTALVWGLDAELLTTCTRQYEMQLPDFTEFERRMFGDALVRRIQERFKQSHVPIVNMREVLWESSLSTVAELLLGRDVRTHLPTLDEAARQLFAGAPSCGTAPWWPRALERMWRRPAGGAALSQMRTVVRRILEERCLHPAQRDDWLSRLIVACIHVPVRMSPTDCVVNHALTSLLAIHQALAATLTWAVYHLARHPHQQQLMAGNGRGPVDSRPAFDGENWRARTERLIRETLRLHPAAKVLVREAVEAVEIGGYVVPQGTWCVVPIGMMQRDPRWFEAPHEFRPERFSDAFSSSLADRAYLPFGAGPQANPVRECVMLGGSRVLATILDRYFLKLVELVPESSANSPLSWTSDEGPFVQLYARRRVGQAWSETSPRRPDE